MTVDQRAGHDHDLEGGQSGSGHFDAGTTDAGENIQVVRATARLRRQNKRKRQTTVVATALTLVFVVVLVALVYAGWKSTLRVTGGRDQKITDPAAPGYTAEAKPTGVELLAMTDPSGGLATMLMFIAGNENTPMTVVPISATLTAWDYEDAGPLPAADLFTSAGMDVLALRLGVDLTFGITSFADMPISTFQPVIDQVGEIKVDLPDNVYGLDENGERFVKYSAGTLVLQPSEVTEFLSFRGSLELELNRSLRTEGVWQAILDKLATSGSSLELPQAVKASVPLLADLRDSSAKGDGGKDGEKPFAIELLPTKDVPLYTSPPAVLDRVDATSMPTWVTRFVPFPSSAYPGQRWVVNLLNGTSDKGVVRKVAPRIVEAGGSIGLTGNASSFDIEKSRVEYVTEDARAAAETVAAQFGISPTKVDLMPSGIDVTVVVGKDLL